VGRRGFTRLNIKEEDPYWDDREEAEIEKVKSRESKIVRKWFLILKERMVT
jgi:hypothetical protein